MLAAASYDRCTRSVYTCTSLVEALSSVFVLYTPRTMDRISEAAARTGLTVPMLRAWERRYGAVCPHWPDVREAFALGP